MAKILIVDDVLEVREAVAAVLRREGHETRLSADGNEAIAELEVGNFDLILVDIFMPGLDGLSFILRVKRAHEVPVIVMSGGGPNATLEHAVALADAYGADGLLLKPFENAELLEKVGRLIPKGA